ncbi:MAG: TadE family protein [Planctomycetota bacterium]|nr:TadE family protein [Planctomycetota bacterium]
MPAARRATPSTRERRGAVLVEMAVVLPVFALLVFGVLEASRLCMASQLLTNTARDGCRVAVSRGKYSSDVTTRVNAALDASGITHSNVTVAVSPSAIENTKLGDQITVTITVSFSRVNWLPSPFFFKTTTVSGRAVMSSERP